jgi:hypothetical protein
MTFFPFNRHFLDGKELKWNKIYSVALCPTSYSSQISWSTSIESVNKVLYFLRSNIWKIFVPYIKLCGADHFQSRGFLSISSPRRSMFSYMKNSEILLLRGAAGHGPNCEKQGKSRVKHQFWLTACDIEKRILASETSNWTIANSQSNTNPRKQLKFGIG